MNDHAAVALAYAHSKKSMPKVFTEQRVVCFIDMGQSSSSVSFVKYSIEDGAKKARVLCCTTDRNLGARNLDDALLEKLAKELQEAAGSNPLSSVKVKLRMLQVIEKARCRLTSNESTDIAIDELMDGEDFERSLDREEYAQINEENKNAMHALVLSAVDEYR